MAKNENKRKLPRFGFKIFGHKSHTRYDRFIRTLNKTNILDSLQERCNKIVLTR